jgi:hypothetical protein
MRPGDPEMNRVRILATTTETIPNLEAAAVLMAAVQAVPSKGPPSILQLGLSLQMELRWGS